MTGAVAALCSPKFLGVPLSGSVADIERTSATTTGLYTASLILYENGTTIGTDASGGTSSRTAWVNPTSSTVGQSWSVMFTATGSGYVMTTPTASTWYSLSPNKGVSVRNTNSSGFGSGTITVSLSRDGGSTTASTFTCAFTVGYTP